MWEVNASQMAFASHCFYYEKSDTQLSSCSVPAATKWVLAKESTAPLPYFLKGQSGDASPTMECILQYFHLTRRVATIIYRK